MLYLLSHKTNMLPKFLYFLLFKGLVYSRLMEFEFCLKGLHSVSASIQINQVHLSNEITTKIHMI